MSTNIKLADNNWFTRTSHALSYCAQYTLISTEAAIDINDRILHEFPLSRVTVSNAVKACPQFKKKSDLSLQEAANGTLKAVSTEIYLDSDDRIWGALPKMKRTHTVNDPQMIRELLHARRGDALLDSGFHQNLNPLVQTDTMLLCPYAEHRNKRSDVEKNFSKRTIQSADNMRSLVEVGSALMMAQTQQHDEQMIHRMVFFSIVNQALGMDLTDPEMEELGKLMEQAVNGDRKKCRIALDTFFAQVIKNRHYKAGGGIAALNESKVLSEAEKISGAILMFAAGMHTTSNLMTLFLHVLHTSEYNEKIYAEWNLFLEGKVIDSKESFTRLVTEFVQTSDLLHACYLEVMRLYPIVPIIKRVAKKDFVLGDTTIYAGDEIHLNVMAAQRDRRHWEQPDQFYPARFQGDLANHPSSSLLNFSIGSQGCIGRHLAESEVKVMGALFSILLTPTPRSSGSGQEISVEEKRKDIVDNFFYNDFVLSRRRGLMIYKHTFQLRHEWQSLYT